MKAVKIATTAAMDWRTGFKRFYAIVPNAVRAENIRTVWTKSWDGKPYPAAANSRTGKAYDYECLDWDDVEIFVRTNTRPYGERMFTEEFKKKLWHGELDGETYEKAEKDCALHSWKGQAKAREECAALLHGERDR